MIAGVQSHSKDAITTVARVRVKCVAKSVYDARNSCDWARGHSGSVARRPERLDLAGQPGSRPWCRPGHLRRAECHDPKMDPVGAARIGAGVVRRRRSRHSSSRTVSPFAAIAISGKLRSDVDASSRYALRATISGEWPRRSRCSASSTHRANASVARADRSSVSPGWKMRREELS